MALDLERLRAMLLDRRAEVKLSGVGERHCSFEVTSERRPGHRAVVEYEAIDDHRVVYMDVYPDELAEAMRHRQHLAGLSGQTYRHQLDGSPGRDPSALCELIERMFLSR